MVENTLTKNDNGKIVPLTEEEATQREMDRQEWTVRKASRVPASVPNWKLRVALRAAGLEKAIADFVETLNADGKDAWEYVSDVPYNSPLVNTACAALKISDEEKASIFRTASIITL